LTVLPDDECALSGGLPANTKLERPEASHAAGPIKLADVTTRCVALPKCHCNGRL
jgi:hypothetical protein